MFTNKIAYALYGVLFSISFITVSAHASGADGVFGDYFTNMTTPCASQSVLVGLSNAANATFGTSICVPLQSMVGSIYGLSSAPSGKAMLGFDSGGNPKFGFVNWEKSGTNISYIGGNVGIGTTNPSYPLHIFGAGNTPTQIFLENMNTTGDVNGDPGIRMKSRSSDYRIFANDEDNRLFFWDNQAGLARMTLNGNGNVGIGNTQPAEKLTVEGNIQLNTPNRLYFGSQFESTDSMYFFRDNTRGLDRSDLKLILGDNNNGDDSFQITNVLNNPMFTVLNNGNIGIGTNFPIAKLNVAGNILAQDIRSNGYIDSYGLRANFGGIYTNGGITSVGGIYGYADISSQKNIFANGDITSQNNVYAKGDVTAYRNVYAYGDITSQKNVYAYGDITSKKNVFANAYYYSSDKRLKNNITPLKGSLEKILSLNGYSFDWKNDGKHDIGVIAQEVEQVFPALVNTNTKTGMKSVEYGNLVAPLIEAMKEQQAEINALKIEIKNMKSVIR